MTNLRLRETDLEWREIDDEVVVLDGRAASYLAVHGSGTLLWRHLARGATRQSLIAAMVEAYAIDEQRAADDTDGFLNSLAAQGLLAA